MIAIRVWRQIRMWWLPLVAMTMLSISNFHLLFAAEKMPAQSPLTMPPHSDFPHPLAATGIVEARRENIEIGTAVSGIILEVCLPNDAVGSTIAAGTSLFRVDDRHWKAELAVQQANLRSAEAQLGRLQQMPRAEELPVSAAKVKAAEALSTQARDQWERGQQMVERKALSEADLIAREAAHLQAQEAWRQAQAEDALLRAGAWHADLAVAQAAVEAARAQVVHLETEIDRCVVRAPVEGRVLRLDVRPGEYVTAASGQALVILGDLSRQHVRVSIDEREIPRWRPEATAVASQRGDSQTQFPLRFVRVEPFVVPKKSFTGDNSERLDTRVLEVIYEMEAAAPSVFVGQQLDVFMEGAGTSERAGR